MISNRHSAIRPSRITRGAFLLGLAAAAIVGVGAAHARQSAPPAAPAQPKPQREVATLAAGCFWSMEAIFKQLKGVDQVLPGYAGGTKVNPSYEDVCTGETGHAESIRIVFDPKVISFKDLLEVMFIMRDPTTLNRQGNDEGNEYRSVVFYHNEQQRKDALEVIKKIEGAHIWPDKIVTEVAKYKNFYRAEDYHLDYFRKHPDQGYCRLVIAPEIDEFHKRFRSKIK